MLEGGAGRWSKERKRRNTRGLVGGLEERRQCICLSSCECAASNVSNNVCFLPPTHPPPPPALCHCCLGCPRSKSTELSEEINKLQKELEQLQRDHASYVTYEKKAEGLAKEIQALTGQLADLNALANNLNDNIDLDDVRVLRCGCCCVVV